jgi:hypothetical protein
VARNRTPFHLGRALRKAAYLDATYADHEAQKELFEHAFWSVADWEALGEFIVNESGAKLADWVTRQRCPDPRAGPAPHAVLRLPAQ